MQPLLSFPCPHHCHPRPQTWPLLVQKGFCRFVGGLSRKYSEETQDSSMISATLDLKAGENTAIFLVCLTSNFLLPK